VPRHGAHLEIMRALRDQQAHQALALQLQRERAVELERGREQHHGADGFTQQLLHGGWIVLVLAQLQPGARETHGVPANGMLLEYEAPDPIRFTHGRRVSPGFTGQPAFSSAAH
jgi:hypothetical protein